MRTKLGIIFLIILALAIFAKWYDAENISASHSLPAQQISLSKPTFEDVGVSSASPTTPLSAVHSISSLSKSSVESLSGARVDPLPEIVHFLNQLDKAIIPKIYLPIPKRDPLFDYAKAKAAELKNKALEGDPYAANFYAEYVVKNGVRTISDKGIYVYESDSKNRTSAMNEAREFYIRAFRGGIASAADVLSKLYANPSRGGNRIESLAWRKISFAVGESERYDCLRNSTICVVKDFNNLNRLEYFYPCLSSSGDSCNQHEYDAAMVLALEYADSLEYAMNNKVVQ